MVDGLQVLSEQDLIARGLYSLEGMRPVLADNAILHPNFANNATLRHEEWLRVDERVNRVLRDRLTVIDDLRGHGLIEPISVGTIIRRTERLQDFGEAQLTYDGNTPPQGDRVSFLGDDRPVPVISKDFVVNWRELIASRERGEALDTTGAEQAARRVRDRMQALVTLGVATGGPNGGGIPGLLTAANRLTVSIGVAWDASGGTPVDDVERMLAEAYSNNLFGPFVVYVPKGYWATVQGDYETSGGAVINRTIMQRILDFSEVEAVRPLDALTADNVVMVQMTRDVMDYSEAQAPTTVQWQINPWLTQFRVIAVGGPHIKTLEVSGGSPINGIVHLS
jgi:uncharacterized linocin/CFP29 family protein